MTELRSQILETGARAIFHTALLFSLFLLLAGHDAPGGGFVGGLVAGAAFVLRDVSGPETGIGTRVRIVPEALLGLGLTIATGTGVAALIAGADFLESGGLDVDLGVLGHVKLLSTLAFDIGVFLVVVGLVTLVLDRLGRDADPEPDSNGETTWS
ncbi:MAG TPA: MnhB domain-containing protein [Acidimicrobiia bacterium]|nr:MnhB domain-containing protein [Acidimicrobiia bacterium]